MPRPSFSLHRTLLAAIGVALLAGMVPAGIVLDRRLARDLADRARKDLAMAPALVADRGAAAADALMMRAKDLAGAPGVPNALARGDVAAAVAILERQGLPDGAEPVVVVARDGSTAGPRADPAMAQATRRGEMPVAVVSHERRVHRVALAPVVADGIWHGAAGLATPLDGAAAGILAGLLRADVALIDAAGNLVATTAADHVGTQLLNGSRNAPMDVVTSIRIAESGFLVVRTPLGNGASVLFARDLQRELALIPDFRQVIVWTGLAALGVALLLGAGLAGLLARPVHALAAASDRMVAGDFHAPLAPTRIKEFGRVGEAFTAMRRALASRLDQLGIANRDLAERERKLTALQAELIQRDRLAASQRLLAELAHEIRNPIANVRNLLEVLRRRATADPEARQFADMAIDELLRMHELAEQMLDLNRPSEGGAGACDLHVVADEVAQLTRTGAADDSLTITVRGRARAAISADALKQVLMNLLQNARDAVPLGLAVSIEIETNGTDAIVEVADNGPGIPDDVLPHVFDPFFTTKNSVHGTGLGLFVAEGLVRRYGGRLSAHNHHDRPGSRFRVELPDGSTPSDTDPS